MNKRLHHMAVFAVVLEEGSFAGAARQLGRSPSVVSVQVRELERSLETRLLHRTTRRLALTESGERYLPHCQAVLAAARELDTLAEAMRTRVAGRLRITAPSALLDELIGPLLQTLLETHPEVEVSLLDSDAREDLDGGKVDVAIRVGALTQLEHRARRIGELREVRVRRAGSPDRVILLPWQAQPQLASAGVLRVSTVTAARCLVAHGLGWATLPEPAVRELVDLGCAQIEGEGPPVPIYAVHAFGPAAPPQVRAFIDIAVATASQRRVD